MKKLFRLSVFFVSYTPLWLSIAYIDLMNVFYHKTPSPWTEIVSVVCICIAYLISVPNMVLTMRKLGKENSEQLQIKSVSEQKTASLEYMLSFVLPMFAFEFTQWETVILFILYFAVLSYLTLKHNLLVANIVFEVLHYQFYDVTAINGYNVEVTREVISKRPLENLQAEDIFLRSMNNGFWCDVTNRQ